MKGDGRLPPATSRVQIWLFLFPWAGMTTHERKRPSGDQSSGDRLSADSARSSSLPPSIGLIHRSVRTFLAFRSEAKTIRAPSGDQTELVSCAWVPETNFVPIPLEASYTQRSDVSWTAS